jgi:catechol 2,3-dioxygenase-like lactoylglutathione lyase family enzyme
MVIRAVPVLPARDVETTVDFWREELGFNVVFRADGYGIVERDGTAVHFFPSEIDPMENDGGCRLGVDDVDSYYEEYREHVYAELEEKPWGTREFAVLDPTRNLIWLVERTA